MLGQARITSMSGEPCPPAENPEAILRWIEQRHLSSGKVEKYRWHLDAFWRRIEEKRLLRVELAAELTADPGWAARVDALAMIFGLEIAGLDKQAQIAAVAAACVPMRFHISAELILLRQRQRSQEVLAMAY